MNTEKIIQLMGGRKKVMEITGLTRSRISQMISNNYIPKAWLVAFSAKNKEVRKLLKNNES